MSSTQLSEEQLQAVRGLLAFLPALENTEPHYLRNGYWSEMYSVVSAPVARDLFRYLYDHRFVLENFDWQSWGETALSYMDDRQKVQTAGWHTLYLLLTTHISAERGKAGHYDEILENGFLRDVLRRMKALLEEA
jgi:hypothetical protein